MKWSVLQENCDFFVFVFHVSKMRDLHSTAFFHGETVLLPHYFPIEKCSITYHIASLSS